MYPPKTQISLGIQPFWSESSLCTLWIAKDSNLLHADSEGWWDWVDAECINHFVDFVMLWLISDRFKCLLTDQEAVDLRYDGSENYMVIGEARDVSTCVLSFKKYVFTKQL